MSGPRGLFILVPFCATLFFHDLTANDLWSAHEARAAQNAQRMIDDTNWLLPRLYDGTPEMQKPPAFYWMVAAIGELRGGTVDRWAVRLPTAIAGLATVLMVWSFLALRGRPLAGLIAGFVLASSVHFNSLARTGRIDMVLTCTTTATVLLLQCPNRKSLAATPLVGVAILLKGPIGLVLPGAVQAVLLTRQRIIEGNTDWSSLLRLSLTSVGGVLLALPWFLWVDQETGGDFFRVFILHHNLERALGDSADLAVHPWWYYLPRFLLDFLPGTPLLLGALWLTLRRREQDFDATLGLLWLATMVVTLSFAQFKRADYLLPAFPGAAIFVGCVCERWFDELRARSRRAATVVSAVLVALSLAGWEWFHRYIEPKQQAIREQAAFATFIRSQAPPPQEIVFFRVESHLLAYHVRRPLRTLVSYDDLNALLREPGPHWFITRAEYLQECRSLVLAKRFEVVAFSADFAPAKPLRPLVLLRTTDE